MSDPFLPNSLAGPEVAADPYAANALDTYGYGAPDATAGPVNALAGTAYRHANSYLGILDYLLGRMPSTAVGLVNAAIPYQPLGGVREAHEASERSLDDFRSLYPSASKAILELTSNPLGPGGLSQGILVGGIGARNLERAGRRTGQQALDLAERMEAQGASPTQIRAATNRLIESGDTRLGGVSKGRDEMRRLELSDEGLQARLGTGYDRVTHPEFEAAYPGTRIFATVEEAPQPSGLIKRREGNEFHMEVRGPTDAARREVAGHEYAHLPQMLESGFAQGADARTVGPSMGPNGLRAGQVVQLGGEEPAYLQQARRIFEREPPGPRRDAMARAIPQLAQEYETARAQTIYDRLAGEVEARSAMARLNLTPAERRARLPELDEDVPRSMQIPWKE